MHLTRSGDNMISSPVNEKLALVSGEYETSALTKSSPIPHSSIFSNNKPIDDSHFHINSERGDSREIKILEGEKLLLKKDRDEDDHFDHKIDRGSSIPSGTRVFKKSSPNNKITAYLGKRDFVDHLTYTDPVDGVILIGPDYVTDGVKVWASILAAFRYGREDLDVLGLTFRKDLYLAVAQVYPPVNDYDRKLTRLQERLIKKLGPHAYPFYFEIPPLAPASVILQPSPNDTGKPCGVDYELKCFAAPSLEDKPLKKSTVRLAIRKVVYAPDNEYYAGVQPHVEVNKDFLMSPGPLQLEISLDKKKYYHGEPIAVNVQITNNSNKTIKKIRIAVRQYADICLFSTAQYKCNVAELESDDGFPLGPCCNLCKVYYLTPLLSENRDKRGLALDGKLKHEDTNLASSTIFKDERIAKSAQAVEENHNNRTKERENLGIIVRYTVKAKLIVAFGQDVSAELGFILTHPPPPPPSEDDTPLQDNIETKKMIERRIPAVADNIPVTNNNHDNDIIKINTQVKRIEEPNLIEFSESHGSSPSTVENGGNDNLIFEDFARLRINQSDLAPDVVLNDPPSDDIDREPAAGDHVTLVDGVNEISTSPLFPHPQQHHHNDNINNDMKSH